MPLGSTHLMSGTVSLSLIKIYIEITTDNSLEIILTAKCWGSFRNQDSMICTHWKNSCVVPYTIAHFSNLPARDRTNFMVLHFQNLFFLTFQKRFSGLRRVTNYFPTFYNIVTSSFLNVKTLNFEKYTMPGLKCLKSAEEMVSFSRRGNWEEELRANLRRVFERCRLHNLKLQLKKCRSIFRISNLVVSRRGFRTSDVSQIIFRFFTTSWRLLF